MCVLINGEGIDFPLKANWIVTSQQINVNWLRSVTAQKKKRKTKILVLWVCFLCKLWKDLVYCWVWNLPNHFPPKRLLYSPFSSRRRGGTRAHDATSHGHRSLPLLPRPARRGTLTWSSWGPFLMGLGSRTLTWPNYSGYLRAWAPQLPLWAQWFCLPPRSKVMPRLRQMMPHPADHTSNNDLDRFKIGLKLFITISGWRIMLKELGR